MGKKSEIAESGVYNFHLFLSLTLKAV